MSVLALIVIFAGVFMVARHFSYLGENRHKNDSPGGGYAGTDTGVTSGDAVNLASSDFTASDSGSCDSGFDSGGGCDSGGSSSD